MRNFHHKILLLLVLGISGTHVLAAPPPALEITENEYRRIESQANKILRGFPRDQYFYLVAGKSLVMFLAYFQAVDPDSAANLPISNLRRGLNIEYRTPEDRELLRRHFERFLPSSDTLKGRKILLIDHLLTGLSLWRTQNYIRTLFDDRYPLQSLGLVWMDSERDFSQMADYKLAYQGRDLLTMFVTKRYQQYSPFGPANLSFQLEKLAEIEANPKYAELLQAMQKARKLYACSGELE